MATHVRCSFGGGDAAACTRLDARDQRLGAGEAVLIAQWLQSAAVRPSILEVDLSQNDASA